MFNLHNTKTKETVFPQSQPLSKLGSVSLGIKNNLGKGLFTPINCRKGGKVYRLHVEMKDVHVGPQGAMYISNQYGEKSDVTFTLSEAQDANIVALSALHESALFLAHPSVDGDIERRTEVLSDGTSLTILVKLSPNVAGDIWEENATFEEKVEALSSEENSLNVTLFASGYYYSQKENSIRLCLTCVDVKKNDNKSKKRRKA